MCIDIMCYGTFVNLIHSCSVTASRWSNHARPAWLVRLLRYPPCAARTAGRRLRSSPYPARWSIPCPTHLLLYRRPPRHNNQMKKKLDPGPWISWFYEPQIPRKEKQTAKALTSRLVGTASASHHEDLATPLWRIVEFRCRKRSYTLRILNDIM